jgi:hypothetical protein
VTEDGSYCDAPEFLADEGVGIEQAIRMMTWNAASPTAARGTAPPRPTARWPDGDWHGPRAPPPLPHHGSPPLRHGILCGGRFRSSPTSHTSSWLGVGGPDGGHS